MDRLEQLSERVHAIRNDAFGRPFTDPSARDTVCALADCLVEVVGVIREHRRASIRAANDASCLANGIKPD